MFLTVTYLDDDPKPSVYSIPPGKTADGSEREAIITVEPFGPDTAAAFEEGFDLSAAPAPEKGRVSLNFSIGEAEELARRLVVVVQAAKQGRFSNIGEELNRFTKEKRLQEAWETLIGDADAGT
ncbi:hypothetical protein MMAN_00320 [Mycobacterium mantenii]|uniref:Uncharacterized protein n=2 Tax=Mycobacterium mantenii TaxID=560555 RepID=A0A1X0G3Z8_MYCNT|nr:hypothetical protein BST30_01885 [Mycobacterium mantenii]BBY35898.1 hypothetical protein MMAN_00320 [Mycobacterium mantenii]